MSYSQDNEEAVILAHFGDRRGSFLDIGAADGIQFSNTRALYERGWKGTMVEPSPRQFMALWKTYGHDRYITLVNAAIERIGGIRRFHYSPDTVVNTIDDDCLETWQPTFSYSAWWISTISALEFRLHFPGPYDFISIDAEGRSGEICIHMDPFQMGAQLVCVEHDQYQGECNRFMEAKGYETILITGNNTIWRRKNVV